MEESFTEECVLTRQRRFKRELLQSLIKEEDHVAIKLLFKWDYDAPFLLSLQNNDGLLPIHQACLSGSRLVTNVLVNAGASTESRSSFGWTALHAATLSGSFELIRFLVEKCAANLLVKDSVECYAVDLTMNMSIRAYLKSKMEEKRTKNRLEALVSTWPSTSDVSRRHSFAAPVRHMEKCRATRTASFHEIQRSRSFIDPIAESTPSRNTVRTDLKDDKKSTQGLQKDDKRDSGIFCMEESEEDRILETGEYELSFSPITHKKASGELSKDYHSSPIHRPKRKGLSSRNIFRVSSS